MSKSLCRYRARSTSPQGRQPALSRDSLAILRYTLTLPIELALSTARGVAQQQHVDVVPQLQTHKGSRRISTGSSLNSVHVSACTSGNMKRVRIDRSSIPCRPTYRYRILGHGHFQPRGADQWRLSITRLPKSSKLSPLVAHPGGQGLEISRA